MTHSRVMGSTTLKNLIAEWPETEHERIMRVLRLHQQLSAPKRQRLGTSTDAANRKLISWLISSCSLQPSDAKQIAAELVLAGCDDVDDVLLLVKSSFWQAGLCAEFARRFPHIKLIHHVKIENACAKVEGERADEAGPSAASDRGRRALGKRPADEAPMVHQAARKRRKVSG